MELVIQNHEEETESCPFKIISGDIGSSMEINHFKGESQLPQKLDESMNLDHISNAKTLNIKPVTGRSHTLGKKKYLPLVCLKRKHSEFYLIVELSAHALVLISLIFTTQSGENTYLLFPRP